MTRLLLMHSIAIITAVCLLATPTEAIPDCIKKKKENKLEDPEELFGELQQTVGHIESAIETYQKSGLMEPKSKHAGPIHGLEAEVLRIFVLGFDLWWKRAVDPDVATEVFRDHENVELAKNALRFISQHGSFLCRSSLRRVLSLSKVTKNPKKALKNAKMIKKKFLLYFNRAGDVFQHQLVAFQLVGQAHFLHVTGPIVAWVENMRQLTIGAFTYDLRRVKNCSVDVWNPQYLSFSSMATYIASDAFNCVKDYLKSNQSEADYKEFEFRLKLLGLLGQIEEQWYKLHNLSIACYNTPKRVAGQMNDFH